MNLSAEIDKSTIEQRFARSLTSYHAEAVIQKYMARQLVTMALPHINCCEKAFEIGCGTGFLTNLVMQSTHPLIFIVNDLVAAAETTLKSLAAQYQHLNCSFMAGDAETIDYPHQCDVVWSGAVIQWFTNVERFFQKAADALNSNGVLAISTFGPENYREVTHASGYGLTYPSLNQLVQLASPWFEVVDSRYYKEVLWFDQPIDVLRHIKATGVGGVNKQLWYKRQLNQFDANYQQFHTAEKGYSLTYQPVLMVLKKKSLTR